MDFFENSHSRIASERCESNTSATVCHGLLQIVAWLLDSSLDQFVEGSDVGRLINSPLILAVASFCLEAEGVGIVGVVLMWGRHQVGLL